MGPPTHVIPAVESLISAIITLDRPLRDCYVTEDILHSYWDAIILHTLSLLGRSRFKFTRNSTHGYDTGTTHRNSRPDLLCWMKQALILRGEEEADEDDMIKAQRELMDKFGVWNTLHYGQLPFVLAYATGGRDIK